MILVTKWYLLLVVAMEIVFRNMMAKLSIEAL